MATYITSDTHFGCKSLVKRTRQRFSSVDEHDESILDSINSMCKRGDHLYIVGDFCWKNPAHWRSKIKCRHVVLVLGNHDKVNASILVFGAAKTKYWVDTRVGGTHVFLAHLPHAHWHKSHRKSVHLYGHTHSAREVELDQKYPGRRSMDIGVDNAYRVMGEYRPFVFDEVVSELAMKAGHDDIVDHEEWGGSDYSNRQ
jgi:calcineurin-like phosphoesterase family protein